MPIAPLVAPRVYTPDDLATGLVPAGPVAVFDFDNYYLGTAVAEDLAAKGCTVTYITTGGTAAAWSFMTNEQPHVYQALARRNITVRTSEIVTGFDGETLSLAHIFSGVVQQIAVKSLVIVGQRAGGAALHHALSAMAWAGAGIKSLHLTGDANAPGAIAHAIYQAHKTAQELGRDRTVVKRDSPVVLADTAV